jgi:hypothetical protein
MMLKIKRHSPGSYSIGLGGLDPQRHYITTVRRMDHLNGWIAAAAWDRFLYSDPVPTYRDAKQTAERMLQEVAAEAKSRAHKILSEV